MEMDENSNKRPENGETREGAKQEEIQRRRNAKTDKKRDKKPRRNFWPLKVLLITLIVSFAFSFVSQVVLGAAGTAVAYILVVVFIAVSIVFDIVAVAAAACDVEPFLAMSARKIKGAKMAVRLAKNAEKVSSVCGDIIGDICGIISGACAAAIAAKQFSEYTGYAGILAAVLLASAVATVTIAGKAAGKTYAINKANGIIFTVARILSVFKKN